MGLHGSGCNQCGGSGRVHVGGGVHDACPGCFTVADQAPSPWGKFVYCSQHLGIHSSDWCTVGEKLNMVNLGSVESEQEAAEKCRRLGLPLFEEQRPQKDLADMAECQLATLEELRGLKSSSQSRIKRQEEIVKRCIDACRRHGVSQRDVERCPRLRKKLFGGR